MKKICCECKIEKNITDYNNYYRSKDGKWARCKDCQRLYNRELYKNSSKRRDKIREVAKRRKIEISEMIKKIKADAGCKDCSIKDPRVLDFDHVKGKKEFEMGQSLNKGASIRRILIEIEKCEVVCANCHRIRTYEPRIAAQARQLLTKVE